VVPITRHIFIVHCITIRWTCWSDLLSTSVVLVGHQGEISHEGDSGSCECALTAYQLSSWLNAILQQAALLSSSNQPSTTALASVLQCRPGGRLIHLVGGGVSE
jgi:hypothetical protein